MKIFRIPNHIQFSESILPLCFFNRQKFFFSSLFSLYKAFRNSSFGYPWMDRFRFFFQKFSFSLIFIFPFFLSSSYTHSSAATTIETLEGDIFNGSGKNSRIKIAFIQLDGANVRSDSGGRKTFQGRDFTKREDRWRRNNQDSSLFIHPRLIFNHYLKWFKRIRRKKKEWWRAIMSR